LKHNKVLRDYFLNFEYVNFNSFPIPIKVNINTIKIMGVKTKSIPAVEEPVKTT
jgi:hypothetical protein